MYFAGDISAEELFRMFFGDAFTPGTGTVMHSVVHFKKPFILSILYLFFNMCFCFK